MKLTLAKQRQDLDKAINYIESTIKELTYRKDVLTRAFNSIDKNKEDILESSSILAQETRKLMCKLNYKNVI